jgi:hypothetical protein
MALRISLRLYYFAVQFSVNKKSRLNDETAYIILSISAYANLLTNLVNLDF